MTWDGLIQPTGKCCTIRRIEYPEFQTGIFGRMERAPCERPIYTPLINRGAILNIKFMTSFAESNLSSCANLCRVNFK